MSKFYKIKKYFTGHRILLLVILCLFGLGVVQSRQVTKKKQREKKDERVYLVHSDNLKLDPYGNNPMAQVLTGNVQFLHKGARLFCDSAYFFQESNSFKAFGHVRMLQGDTLSLFSDYAYYDGNAQMAEARYNVVLTHRQTKLFTDSLNYDRLYGIGYFFEGGKMVDKQNVLVADWGEYDSESRKAVFNYNVKLKNPKFVIDTDTLNYDTKTSVADVVGPSVVTSGDNVIHTTRAFYDSNNNKARLLERSTLINQGKELTGDSLVYDEKTGVSRGFRNVVYRDTVNKNQLVSNTLFYNEKTGYAFATDSAVMMDYSQKDTLFAHSDTMKVYTFNMNTDSVYRRIHCYNHVRAYRTDVQAVCDSLVYDTKDSCMTMYKDPILWNVNRQVLGEQIKVYMNDSTISRAHVINQAFSAEMLPDSISFNQLSSREMFAFFENGDIRKTEAVGNVLAAYYHRDEKDSTLLGMFYIETDTMRMYITDRQLESIWTNKSTGVGYPITQLPPHKAKLPSFVWFGYIRPVDKHDIFNWRGKKSGTELRSVKRSAAPLQHIGSSGVTTIKGTADGTTVNIGSGGLPPAAAESKKD